jgi:hypothetical protein
LFDENELDSWQQFFYLASDLKDEKFGSTIRVKNEDTRKDLRMFKSLIESVFSPHNVSRPKMKTLNSLEYLADESNDFFDKQDIDNLFISEYYHYPGIRSLDIHDIRIPIDSFRSDNVFNEIKGQISSPNMVVLLGDVGEGKSTFLSKLALDLANNKSEQQYYPIIIDMLKHNHLLESENKRNIPNKFWKAVSDHIATCLQEDHDILISNVITREISKSKESIIALEASLNATLAMLKGKYSDRVSKKQIHESKRLVEPYSQILQAANELNKHKLRLVVIFDNLDTYYSDHERFMLFKSSWMKVETKVKTIRNIFLGVADKFYNSKISLIFTARPYVYTHIFQSGLHESSNGKLKSVYMLDTDDINPSQPVESRFNMLNDLVVKKIAVDDTIPPGKKKILEQIVDEFVSLLSQTSRDRDPINKLYQASNQGFRSVVNFYQGLHIDKNLFQRYFTHDILYLYLLSNRSLYSQITPEEYPDQPVSHFPNVFLINCDVYYNNNCPESRKPHRLTYWLKYLILAIVHHKKRINIKYILNILQSYDDNAVRLCLGSLSTANETNCLNLEFPFDINGLRQIEDSTVVTMTRRGKFLFENNNSFSFEFMQLYFDDWLLPRPLPQYFSTANIEISQLLKSENSEKSYSYDYLLDADWVQYNNGRKNIIRRKAKQALLLLSILRSAQTYEMEEYSQTWLDIKQLLGQNNDLFLGDAVLKKLQDNIISTAFFLLNKNEQFRQELRDWQDILSKNKQYFDDFFAIMKTSNT